MSCGSPTLMPMRVSHGHPGVGCLNESRNVEVPVSTEHSTFWLLYGKYGPTLSLDQFCRDFFPKLTLKAVRNRIARGDVPKPIDGVLDVRDIANWWDKLRTAHAPRGS